MRNGYKILTEKLEGKRDHPEDLRADKRIMLKWMLRK
jgi:hypothetical protein